MKYFKIEWDDNIYKEWSHVLSNTREHMINNIEQLYISVKQL
jgi:hypothetical protein